MSEETYESNSEKQGDTTAGKVSAEVTQKSMQGGGKGWCSFSVSKTTAKENAETGGKEKCTEYKTGG